MYAKGAIDCDKLLRCKALTVQQAKHPHTFVVETPGKKLFFRADNRQQQLSWINVLNAVIFKAREAKLQAIRAAQGDDEESSGVSDLDVESSDSSDEE